MFQPPGEALVDEDFLVPQAGEVAAGCVDEDLVDDGGGVVGERDDA